MSATLAERHKDVQCHVVVHKLLDIASLWERLLFCRKQLCQIQDIQVVVLTSVPVTTTSALGQDIGVCYHDFKQKARAPKELH